MRKRIVVIALLLCLFLFSLVAYVIGGTNLGYLGYPEYNKTKPTQPFTSYKGTVSKFRYETYKSSVEDYVDGAKEYIENGNNDINRIQEEQREAIKSANDVVDEYNRWLESVEISSSYY